MCAIVFPAGHVMVILGSPAGTIHVHGAINVSVGQAALKLRPSTSTETNFGSAGKFLGGLPAKGVFEHWLRRTLVKTLNPVRKPKLISTKSNCSMVNNVAATAEALKASASIYITKIYKLYRLKCIYFMGCFVYRES